MADDRKPPFDASSPADIRAAGWTVAVHNDYSLNGARHTFWLFTRADPSRTNLPGEGRYAKGEGRTDAEALDEVRLQIGLSPCVLSVERSASVRDAGLNFARYKIPESLRAAANAGIVLCDIAGSYAPDGYLAARGLRRNLDAFTAFMEAASAAQGAANNKLGW